MTLPFQTGRMGESMDSDTAVRSGDDIVCRIKPATRHKQRGGLRMRDHNHFYRTLETWPPEDSEEHPLYVEYVCTDPGTIIRCFCAIMCSTQRNGSDTLCWYVWHESLASSTAASSSCD